MGHSVWIIDDDPSLGKSMQDTIEDFCEGVTCIHLDHAQSALQELKKRIEQCTGTTDTVIPNVIIVDGNLDHDKGSIFEKGERVIAEIQRTVNGIIEITLYSLSGDEDRRKAMLAEGAHKAFDKTDAISLIRCIEKREIN